MTTEADRLHAPAQRSRQSRVVFGYALAVLGLAGMGASIFFIRKSPDASAILQAAAVPVLLFAGPWAFFAGLRVTSYVSSSVRLVSLAGSEERGWRAGRARAARKAVDEDESATVYIETGAIQSIHSIGDADPPWHWHELGLFRPAWWSLFRQTHLWAEVIPRRGRALVLFSGLFAKPNVLVVLEAYKDPVAWRGGQPLSIHPSHQPLVEPGAIGMMTFALEDPQGFLEGCVRAGIPIREGIDQELEQELVPSTDERRRLVERAWTAGGLAGANVALILLRLMV